MLISPEDVRKVIGVSPEDASDLDIEPYIEKAQRELLNDIAIQVIDNTLSGSINGINTTFSLSHGNIADSNFDGTVDANDITVYAWGEINEPATKVKMTVSSLDAYYGKVYMASAPANTFDILTADYYYYPRKIDTNLMKDACAFLAGYYYVLKEYLLIPDAISHGALRIRHGKPYMMLLDEYYRIIDKLLAMPYVKTEHGEPTEIRGK